MPPSAKREREKQLESGKRDFHGAILLSYPLLVMVSPLLGLTSAVLYIFKFTIAFTNGPNYHNKMKKLLIEALYNKQEMKDLMENAIDEGVEQAYAKYGNIILENPDTVDLETLKFIPQDVVCHVAAKWFLNKNLSPDEKKRIHTLFSDVIGLLNDVTNAGLVAELHSLLTCPKTFLKQVLLFPFKRGGLFHATRRLGSDESTNLDSFWTRCVFVFKLLSGWVSPSEQHPLLKGMATLRTVNKQCLAWTKSAKPGSFLHAFKTEVSTSFNHLSKMRCEQMVASNAIFLLGALLRVTMDEHLITFESLYGADANEEERATFYEMLHFYFVHSSSQSTSKAELAVAEKWGDYLKGKTSVQTVDRPCGQTAPRVCLGSNSDGGSKALPFSTMLDKNNCPGKRLGVLLMGKIFLKFQYAFEALGQARRVKIVSQSKPTDTFYRVDNLVDAGP